MNKTLNQASWALMLIMSVGVAGYALVGDGSQPLGSLVHPDMRTVFEQYPVGIYAHVFASLIALALGPLQFSNTLRQKHLNFHRWNGRVYLFVGVLIGGLSGLYMSQFAYGGLVSESGFFVLAVLWLVTGVLALRAILSGDVMAHRRWMIRNFSLTFAAVTLRIYLGLFFAVGIPFEVFYPVIAWLCWVPNLIIAEAIFNRQKTN